MCNLCKSAVLDSTSSFAWQTGDEDDAIHCYSPSLQIGSPRNFPMRLNARGCDLLLFKDNSWPHPLLPSLWPCFICHLVSISSIVLSLCLPVSNYHCDLYFLLFLNFNLIFTECLPKQLQTLSHSVTDISLFIKCNDLGNPQFLPLSSREISGTWITQPDIIRANVWICPICPYHFCSVL